MGTSSNTVICFLKKIIYDYNYHGIFIILPLYSFIFIFFF